MLSGHFGAPVAELNNGNNNGIITAGRCDYFNHDQSSHLDGERMAKGGFQHKNFPPEETDVAA